MYRLVVFCLTRKERKDKAARQGNSLLKHTVPLRLSQPLLSRFRHSPTMRDCLAFFLSQSAFLCETTTIPSVRLARAKNHSSLCYEKMHKSWLQHISNPPNTKQRIRALDQVSRVQQPRVSIFLSIPNPPNTKQRIRAPDQVSRVQPTSLGQVRCASFPGSSTAGAAISTFAERPASSLFAFLQALLSPSTPSNMPAQLAWVTPSNRLLPHPRPPFHATASSHAAAPPASKPTLPHGDNAY